MEKQRRQVGISLDDMRASSSISDFRMLKGYPRQRDARTIQREGLSVSSDVICASGSIRRFSILRECQYQ